MSRSVERTATQTEYKSVSGALCDDGAAWVLPLVGRAIDRVMPRKEAAALMGIDQGNLTRQLSGEGHLSTLRLGALGPAFWTAFTDEIRAHFGLDNRAECLRRAQEYDELARRFYAQAAGF